MTGAEPVTSRSTSLTILAAIAGAAALYLGQEVFIPIALGLMMTALVRPLVQLAIAERNPLV